MRHGRVRDDVAELGLDHPGDLRVRVRSQLEVVLGSPQVGVAHVRRQVGQHHRQAAVVSGPATQVLHGEPVTQRMDVRAARGEMRNVRIGEVAAQPVVDRGLVGRLGRIAGVEQMVSGLWIGVRGHDICLQRVGEAPGEGHDPVLTVLAVAHLERGALLVEITQLQVERFGETQPGGVEDPEQHRVNQRPVGHLRQRLGIDRVK